MKAVLLAVTMLLVPVVAAGQPKVLTLDEALDRAFAAAPSLAAAGGRATAAAEDAEVAFAGYLPDLTLDAAYSRTTGNYAAQPGTTPAVPAPDYSGQTYNYFNFALTLSQPVYDFGRTGWAHEAARANAEAARKDQAQARLDLWYQVATRYVTAVAAAELLRVAESTRDLARRSASQAEGMYRAGARPRIDALVSASLAAAAEAGVVQAREQLAIAKSALLQAMGVDGPADFSVVRPALAGAKDPPDTEEAKRAAIAARPEPARLDAVIRAHEADVRRVKGDYWPILSVGASGSANGSEFTRLAPNWSVGAMLSWPLFSGLATLHGVRAAEARLAAARAERRGIAVTVRAEVDQARSALVQALERIPALDAAVIAAREAVTLAEGRYRGGEGSQSEVLEAQRTLGWVELERVRGDLAVDLARLALDRALGRMPERLRTR